MRAGDAFMQTLLDHQVNCIFGNPGTTENPLLDRLVDFEEIKYYTTLHEGVAVGAATFYALATGRTPVVNVHVTPGLGNSIGLLFGALKARAPMVVTAGQQDTRLLGREALFAHDLVAMAAPVTKWSVEPSYGHELEATMRRAFEVANEPPFGPVFVSLPVDVMEQEVDSLPDNSPGAKEVEEPDYRQVEELTELLLSAERPVFIIGDEVAKSGEVSTMVRLVEQTGSVALRECIHAQIAFPADHPHFRGHIPFDAANIRKILSVYDLIVMVGGQFFEEMWFEKGSPIPQYSRAVRIEATEAQLSTAFKLDIAIAGDIGLTLQSLLASVKATASAPFIEQAQLRHRSLAAENENLRQGMLEQVRSRLDDKPMLAASALQVLSEELPEQITLIDESLTTALLNISDNTDSIVAGALYSSHEIIFKLQTPLDYFAGRGGGLGQGMAGAIGLQVACPERRVVALIGDGSAMYGIQALWSAAHLSLPVIFVIFSNREYRVLKHNLDIYRHRFKIAGNRPYPHMDLASPALDYVMLARGHGVDGATVETAQQLREAIATALSGNRPYLIDITVAGKS